MYELIVHFNTLYGKSIPLLVVYIVGYLVGTVVMCTVVFPWHNYVQCIVAERCGCVNMRNSGYMTLSPKKSFQWIGALSVVLFQMGFCEPIEYNEEHLRRRFLHKVYIQLSGILFYAAVSFVVMIAFTFLSEFGIAGCYSNVNMNLEYLYGDPNLLSHLYCSFYISLKFVLKTCFMCAILNVVPIPPLDSYKLLIHTFSDKIKENFVNHQFLVSFLVLAVVFVVLANPNGYFFSAVNSILSEINGLLHNLFNMIGL